MQMKTRQRGLSFFLVIMLIVSIALFVTGCSDSVKEDANSNLVTETRGQETEADGGSTAYVMGEGNTKFTLTVTDKEGTETQFEIHTDKTTVGEALKELELIDGEESEYGLYVKTVNGITADYDKDGVYWAFYVNGEYATSGVDTTTIVEEDSYAFKVE